MCCCCPSAISALFCLWVQSGCNKGSVAGALTFFPPEPALYEFERHDKSGRVLGHNEEAPLDEETNENAANDEDNSSVGEIRSPDRSGPFEAPATHGQTKEKIKSPFEQLADQAVERRKRSKMRIARDSRDKKAGVSYRLLLDPRLQVPPHEDGSIHALKIPSPGGVYVAAVLYSVPPSRRSERTRIIIYSHGNATDIGAMFPLQIVMAHSLDCDVLVYDYSGYGESGGVPEEASTYRDIDAVYEYICREVVNQRTEKIILYGQSVGSGPCCYLAAKVAKQKKALGGMILHSPFTSGMRVLTPSRLLACLDIYPNIDRIKKIRCPCMLIHGYLDQEVDISHGQDLHKAVPDEYKRDPWWVADRGHNDITDGPGKLAEYIRRLRGFLESLERL
ncbi:hypothetical protein FisN_10Hh236 [Fistulifera solaris]|uniref:Serine aminopeptidase S33 domain-containing protein n=1 Tax=Fistulifera solaris TaxID=1519565 RepID=A0A1Z5JWZ6_FISSO|nr:hypothetical protein FisN_10Hh236 [Fistulifera solaris]|eukprot:GAX18563.1 hypothetical protein FisN_10Hh236 [Fistulifera solaris]